MVSLLAADLPETDAHPKRLQRVLLISTYELGHQPFGLAEPIAWLRRAGHDFRALDLAVERLDEAFTPWTSVHGYLDLLAAIADLDLVEAVPSIQLAIRLLIPPGSLLLELAEVQELVGPLDEAALVHPWSNPHPGADALQAEVQRLVQRGAEMPRRAVFESVWLAAHAATQRPVPALPTVTGGGPPPHLSEAWYCCAEPSDGQRVRV